MKWRKTVNIRPILDKDEDTDESAVNISRELAEFLSSQVSDEPGIQPIITALNKVRTQRGANKVVERLYDWADDHRIWLGI